MGNKFSFGTQVDPTCTYADIPYMASTDSKITFAGGVNCPKIVRLGRDFLGCNLSSTNVMSLYVPRLPSVRALATWFGGAL
eukprot:1157203-Pelagomonas_calceolata.AAC.12